MSELAMVTGASRGIGAATARLLAHEGYRVLCLARSAGELDALAQEDGRLVPAPVDLSEPDELDETVDRLLDSHGAVAVLVNNAGYGLRGALEDLSLGAGRRLFEVNLWSVLRLCQKVLPGMRERGRGTIVNLSSVAGLVSTPFSGLYCASKFALEALSDALRLEVRPFGVRVVLVEPGPVKTDFLRAASEVSDPVLDDEDSPYAARYRKLRENVAWVHERAVPSAKVARVVLRAVRARRPRARYGAYRPIFGLPSLLRRLFPAAVLDTILARRMGLR